MADSDVQDLPPSADANRRKRFKSADEAWSVLRGYGAGPAERALELKKAIAAGIELDAWLVTDVHGALLDALAASKDDPEDASTWMYVFDPKDSRASRSIIRGVFKRFEEAFGDIEKSLGRS